MTDASIVQRAGAVASPYQSGWATGFFDDDFTGTAGTVLTSHTPDVGSGYSHSDGTTSAIVLDGSGAVSNSGTYQAVKNLTTPPDADYEIEFEWEQVTAGFLDGQMRMYLRFTAFKTCYMFDNRGTAMRIAKQNGAALVDLATSYTTTPAAGSINTGKLQVVGTNLTFFVNGTSRGTVSDSSISGAGTAGLFLANGNVKVRRLTARDI